MQSGVLIKLTPQSHVTQQSLAFFLLKEQDVTSTLPFIIIVFLCKGKMLLWLTSLIESFYNTVGYISNLKGQTSRFFTLTQL